MKISVFFVYFFVFFSLSAQDFEENFFESEKETKPQQVWDYLNEANRITRNDPIKGLNMTRKIIENDKLADTLLIKALNIAGGACIDVNNIKEANKYYSRALKLSKKSNNYQFLPAKIGLGCVYDSRTKYDTAYTLYAEALKYARNHEQYYLANIYNNMGLIEIRRGNRLKGIDLYLKAVDEFEKRGELSNMAIAYNNIAKVNYILNNYSGSIYYLKKAIDMNVKNNNDIQLVSNYQNYGSLLMREDSVNKGREYFNKALSLLEELDKDSNVDFNYDYASVYHSIGDALLKLNKNEQAKKYFDSSITIAKAKEYDYIVTLNKISYANYYINNSYYEKADSILKNVLKKLDTYDLPQKRKRVIELLYKAQKGMGNYDTAVNYLEQFKELSDSLNFKKNNELILSLQENYRSIKQQKELIKQDRAIYKLKTKNQTYVILALILITLLIIALFSFIYVKKRNAYKKQLAEIEKEKLNKILKNKEHELAAMAMQLTMFTRLMNKLTLGVKQIIPKLNNPDKLNISQTLKEIDHNMENEIWKEFYERFDHVHSGFFRTLIKYYPDISSTELRICSLIRLNFTVKQIAELLDRSERTINNVRSKLRKKMNLDSNDCLNHHLINIK